MSDDPESNAAPEAEASGAASALSGSASEQDSANVAQAGPNDNFPKTAIDFLRAFHNGRKPCLVAISPDKKRIAARTPADAAECAAWIADRNGSENLYHHVNATRAGLGSKAKKEDITAARWLHVDIDARVGEPLESELERIRALLEQEALAKHGIPPATCVVFSGGGYQAFWRLAKPVGPEEFPRVEAINMQIADRVGGDAVHDINRIMRLPGTWNVPDAKKRAKGREKAMARLEWINTARSYALEDFPQPPDSAPEPKAKSEKKTARALGDLAELDQWGVPDNVKRMALEGTDDPVNKPHVKGQRSERVYRFCCEMVRREVPDEVIAGILTDARFVISESVLELGSRAQRYAERQVERASEAFSEFDTNEDGRILATQANIRRAVARLGIALSYDQFANRLLIDGREMQDSEVEQLYLRIEQCYRFRPSQEYFWMVVKDAARRNAFHPVRDYLDGLRWDGTPRIDRWLATYGGAADTAYTRAVGSLVMIAAVRRVRQPGCVFQEMLVLESPQGKNKSTALKTLAVSEEWFTDDLPLGVESRIVVEKTEGKWIVEAAELSGMRKAQVETLKAFISRSKEQGVRRVYGRLAADVPRQFVLAGTTNNDKYLQDQTGNRRFWPVRVEAFDIAALERDRDQLWAEAAAREAAGESVRLDPRLYDTAAAEQADRMVEDPWEDLLREALGEAAGKVLASDIWREVGVERSRRTQADNVRLGAIMKRLGFMRKEMRPPNSKKTFKGYERGTGGGWLLDHKTSPLDPPNQDDAPPSDMFER